MLFTVSQRAGKILITTKQNTPLNKKERPE